MIKAAAKKTKKPAPTRERILDGALKLFNEKGQSLVTTSQIAESLGISEGNLWYHFRTKREIGFELLCRLEAEIDGNLSRIPEENADFRHFLGYAARAFEYLWDYRFLFRDRFEAAKDEAAAERISELTVRGQQNLNGILEQMRRREMLFLSIEEAESLAVNAWIVHSNWIRFLQLSENIQLISENHIKRGFAQLISLFNPYLSETGKREAAVFIREFSSSRFDRRNKQLEGENQRSG